MTIIAAAYDNPENYALAADSYAIVNGLRLPRRKVHRVGRIFFGSTGLMSDNERAARAIRDGVSEPYAMDTPLLLGMIWATLTQDHKDSRPVLETHFLAVGPDGVWLLGTDGGIGRAPDRWAIGCGEDVGVGAMFQRDGTPAHVVSVAVSAACALREGCFGVPVVLEYPEITGGGW